MSDEFQIVQTLLAKLRTDDTLQTFALNQVQLDYIQNHLVNYLTTEEKIELDLHVIDFYLSYSERSPEQAAVLLPKIQSLSRQLNPIQKSNVETFTPVGPTSVSGPQPPSNTTRVSSGSGRPLPTPTPKVSQPPSVPSREGRPLLTPTPQVSEEFSGPPRSRRPLPTPIPKVSQPSRGPSPSERPPSNTGTASSVPLQRESHYIPLPEFNPPSPISAPSPNTSPEPRVLLSGRESKRWESDTRRFAESVNKALGPQLFARLKKEQAVLEVSEVPKQNRTREMETAAFQAVFKQWGLPEQVRVEALSLSGNTAVIKFSDPKGHTVVLRAEDKPVKDLQYVAEIMKNETLAPYLTTTFHSKSSNYHNSNDKSNYQASEVFMEACARSLRGEVAIPLNEKIKQFDQILSMMQQFQAAGYYSGDLKPSNILMDSKGNVKMADLKSWNKPGDKFQYSTPSFLPLVCVVPMMKNGKVANFLASSDWQKKPEALSKVMSYQMGLLMYMQLTGDTEIHRNRQANGQHQFNFKHDVFNSIEGQQLYAIIRGLTHPLPTERTSLQEAQEILSWIPGAKSQSTLASSSNPDEKGTSPRSDSFRQRFLSKMSSIHDHLKELKRSKATDDNPSPPSPRPKG